MKHTVAYLLAYWVGFAVFPSVAADQVILIDMAGNEQLIGRLEWGKNGEYRLDIDHGSFKDFFLSMKEMKCLEGPKELWCHIPYPYDMPREWTSDDYRWLSQDLLFMYKRPGEFGANLWQGVYYRISQEADHLIGTAMHIDLNELAAPPDDLRSPFYDEDWLEPIDPNEHWLPTLIIR